MVIGAVSSGPGGGRVPTTQPLLLQSAVNGAALGAETAVEVALLGVRIGVGDGLIDKLLRGLRASVPTPRSLGTTHDGSFSFRLEDREGYGDVAYVDVTRWRALVGDWASASLSSGRAVLHLQARVPR